MPRPCCRPKPVCQEQEDFEMKRKKPKNQNPKYRPPKKPKIKAKQTSRLKKNVGAKNHTCILLLLNVCI
jgi:hypothetical protein